MNSLQLKIQEASTFFQTHDFRKSLQIYDQCISICKKNQQSRTLLHNLFSSKAALMSILGDQKGALQCLSEVLKEDPYNTLCLMRRSQVLKKKNKLNKALKDLRILENFSPDNLQIAAMKVEIQNLKLKSKQVNSSSQSESDSQKSSESNDIDDQQKLNFSNLKLIDRKSVSIMIKPQSNARKSRVTIAGDIAIEYDAPQDDEKDNKSFASTNVSKQNLKEKYLKTFRQIELDDAETSQQGSLKEIQKTPVLKVNTPTNGRTKSILKNRNSEIYVDTQTPVQKQKKYGGRQSKMINLLKNIDGKVIQSTLSQRSSQSIKQVQFRKSMFGKGNQINVSIFEPSQNQNVVKQKQTRKSCLKRPSFEAPKQQKIPGTSQPRRSKFDMMSKMSIDGIVLKSKRKSIQNSEEMKQNIKVESDSDQGSQHNIFGSNQIVISKQIRENLGLKEDSGQVVKKTTPKPRETGSKSILKKNSVVMKTAERSKQPSPLKQTKKAKKSVMFTRFD